MSFNTIGMWITEKSKVFEKKTVRVTEIIPLSVMFCLSVGLSNLALAYNTVSIALCFKICATPMMVFVQYFFYRETHSRLKVASSMLVFLGIQFITVTSLDNLTFYGSLIAILAMLTSTLYVIVSSRHNFSALFFLIVNKSSGLGQFKRNLE